MRAVHFSKPGGAEVLEVINTTIPIIHPDEILIKVMAAGINRPDIIQREGNYPPPNGHSKILGLEVSGIVEEVGKNVKNFSVGDEVAALVNGGGYAEYCKANKDVCFRIPKNISFNEAACIPECFFTAWSNIVKRGNLKEKQKILIHGGTSGVGLACIQIAKLFDAFIVTTVGNQEKVNFCKKIGVNKIINYKEHDFFDVVKESDIGGINLILDFIGGNYISKNINLLSNDGKLVNIGFQNGSKVELNLMKVMLKRLTLTGSTLRIRSDSFKKKILDDLKIHVFPSLENGGIKIYIDSVFNLEDVVKAHQRLEEGKHIGKVVLIFKD